MAIFYRASTAKKTLPASFCSIQKLPRRIAKTLVAIAGKTGVDGSRIEAQVQTTILQINASPRSKDGRTAEAPETSTGPTGILFRPHGSAESSPRDRSYMRPSIEPCDESSLDFFGEHPQAYCGHRHARAHTLIDGRYTQNTMQKPRQNC